MIKSFRNKNTEKILNMQFTKGAKDKLADEIEKIVPFKIA